MRRGETEQPRNVEGFDDDDNVVDQHREQRRPHDRQDNPQCRLADAAASHGALFFQRWIHGAKRSRNHEISRRHQPQALNEAHARTRIDIERSGVSR
jgi:hypothetical protein